MPPKQLEGYDEFASVFDSLTDKGETPDAEDTATDPAHSSDLPAGNDEQQTQPADGTGDPAEPAAEGGDPAPADGEGTQDDKGGEPAGSDPQPEAVDWEARFAAQQAEIEALRAGQTPPAADPEPAPVPSVYTPEEIAELAELQNEWPDLHRLFSLMSRQLQVDTLNYAFSEVSKAIAPLQSTVETYTTNDHMAAIYEAHEDYDAVYQPTMEWIEKQPSFLKTAYQNVVKQGTAEDVATMIQRFKDETKWVAPTAQAPAANAAPAGKAPAPAQQQTELSAAAKQAAKAMGAVGAKRGAPAGAQDPNDFDSAWDEATSTK
jgi:hypothetical protein